MMAAKPEASAVVHQRRELATLTSYSDTVFLLPSRIFVDSKPLELLPATGDAGGSILRCEHPQFQFPLKEVFPQLSELIQTSGACRMGRIFSEPTPVFEVSFDSQDHIQRMLGCLKSGSIRDGMKSIILPSAQGAWKQANPDAEEPAWRVDIDLELLQVLPDADEKDAIVLRVIPENCSACVHHWIDRKVFDVGSLLERYRSKSISGGAPACREMDLFGLIQELKEVTGWMQLGIQLRIPKHTLDKIYMQFYTQGEDMCKIEMLSAWLNSRTEVPTWAEVVSAVSRTGNKRVASKMASKYGLALVATNDIDHETISESAEPTTDDAMEPLKRQMEETHTAIEILDIESQLCTNKKRKLENGIAKTQQTYDKVEQYTGWFKKKLDEKENEVKSLQAQLLEYERTICELKEKLTKATARPKKKSSHQKQEQKRDFEEKLQREIAKKTAQLDRAKTKLEVVRTELDQKNTQLDRVRTELLEAKYKLETKSIELDEVKHKLQEIENQRDALRKRLDQQETALEEEAMHQCEGQAHLKFDNWNPCKSMPIGMSSAKAVLLDGRVYIGGGVMKKVEDQYAILVYVPESDEWSQLPPCPVRCFAMAVVKHHLVLAGGLESDKKCSDKLTVWDGMSKKWTHPYPAMPTARCNASAVGYQIYAVVAGGGQSFFHSSAIVEVLDTRKSKWYEAQPAPIDFNQMTTAIIGETLYLLGGCTTETFGILQVFRTSLPALIREAISDTPTPTSPDVTPLWEWLPNIPLLFSTAVVVRTSLLAFGGQKESDNKRSSCVHLYNPEQSRYNYLIRRHTHWMTIGNMPVPLSCATCIMLPSGHILLLGGHVRGDIVQYSEQVFKVLCEYTYDSES